MPLLVTLGDLLHRTAWPVVTRLTMPLAARKLFTPDLVHGFVNLRRSRASKNGAEVRTTY